MENEKLKNDVSGTAKMLLEHNADLVTYSKTFKTTN